MVKEKKFVTSGGFIGNFIVDFIIWNFLLGLAYQFIIAFISSANQSLAGVINVIGIVAITWGIVYIAVQRVFSFKKLKIEDSKKAFIGVAVIVVIFALIQFYMSYDALVMSLNNPWLSSGTFVPSVMHNDVITQGIILYAIQSVGIILVLPFANKWIKNRCVAEENIVNNEF